MNLNQILYGVNKNIILIRTCVLIFEVKLSQDLRKWTDWWLGCYTTNATSWEGGADTVHNLITKHQKLKGRLSPLPWLVYTALNSMHLFVWIDKSTSPWCSSSEAPGRRPYYTNSCSVEEAKAIDDYNYKSI